MKKMFFALIAFLVCFCFSPGPADAADVAAVITQDNGVMSLTWTLATNQTVSGASDTATGVEFCRGRKSLTITTSGTVSISYVITDDGVDMPAFSMAASGSKKKSASHEIKEMHVTSTITTGTIDSIVLRCRI